MSSTEEEFPLPFDTGLNVLSIEPVVGLQTSVKSVGLEANSHPTKTLIGPVMAFAGTVVVIVVAVLAVTMAGTPLKSTKLSAGIVLKLVPVIVTTVPATPLAGENEVMVGVGGHMRSKSVKLLTVLQSILMVIGTKPPGLVGTLVVMLVVVLAVTAALAPRNSTMLSLGTALKFVPVIVTIVPGVPVLGVKEVMVGGTRPHVTAK